MNNLPVCNSLKEAIRLTFGRDVTIESRQRVHGGDANDSYALLLSNGKRAFIKENTISNADSFRAEAEGIDAIKSTNTLRVPEIYALGTDAGNSFLTGVGSAQSSTGSAQSSTASAQSSTAFLLMEFIDRRSISKSFWEDLGRGLAAMHKADTGALVCSDAAADGASNKIGAITSIGSPSNSLNSYGFHSDNFIGAGRQINTPKSTWIEFFSECRLRPQFKLAEHYFDDRLIKAANHLINNLDKYLYEPEKPSLLHGDLWSGNFMSDENGNPMLIDPAVYVGCSETDIAMTELFGGFDRRFYDAYFEEMGETPGYDDRRDLYNLYHLTNHLNIFGSTYLPAVARVLLAYQ